MKQTLFISLCYFISLISIAQPEWELSKDKNNIKVYTRQKEGYSIKEFKAETLSSEIDFNKVCEWLLNTDRGEEWIADVSEAKFISKPSKTETFCYYKLLLPWPFDNRDMVLHNDISQSESRFEIIMKSNPEQYEIQPGVVRITKAEGKWIVTKLPSGETKIEYYFVGDPAGSIPTWVANLFVVDGPLTTINNLIQLSKKE